MRAFRYNRAVSPRNLHGEPRDLPSIGRLLEHPAAVEALQRLPRTLLANALRAEVGSARVRMRDGYAIPPEDLFIERALARIARAERPSYSRAINATGVILHTGLGRAALADTACRALAEAARHCALEIDLETGRRGSRQIPLRALLCELTGAEDALVVNNNAGAVFLAVTALAAGREVILSRGESVEIGGSFRMPDIVRAGGATLVEVGTTNRTRLSDFAGAITERTGLILRCHPSNFKIVGFTEETPAADLARLGHEHGVPVMDDLGSGALLDTTALGGGPTTTLQEAIASGCDIVTASGDKLLGGPQSGLILGKRSAVQQIARHPLARALRIDKLTAAALEATLQLYHDPERARAQIPTLRYLSRSPETLRRMAQTLAKQIELAAPNRLRIAMVEERSQVGGGSLPGEDLPTVCVRLSTTEEGLSEEALAARLRQNDPPVFARLKDGAILLDPRTLEEDEFAEIAEAVGRAV